MALNLIGAGLGRTGTASIKVALETLGLGNCYHMTEVMKNPAHNQLWLDVAAGNPDWDTIFGNYGATVDYPACIFWKELMDFYPEAKVLLTVRDADSWFDSTRETIMAPRVSEFIRNSPWGQMIEKTIWTSLDHRMQDRAFMVDYFNKRNAEITAAVPADRLLVYQVKEGWGPLCDFLELPVPEEEFPRINSREETRELFDNMIAASGEELTDEVMAASAKELHGD